MAPRKTTTTGTTGEDRFSDVADGRRSRSSFSQTTSNGSQVLVHAHPSASLASRAIRHRARARLNQTE